MNTEKIHALDKLLKANRINWPDFTANHALSSFIRQMDEFLRRRQNIFEFCDDPNCLLRIALHPASAVFILPNGFRLRSDDFIGELHLWNDHIPMIPADGPDFAWAKLIRRRTAESFALLAKSVRSDSRFDNVQIFFAQTRMGGNMPPGQFQRLMEFFGFEVVEELICGDWHEQLVGLAECLHFWSLLRAFNPIALANHRLFRLSFRQLWMSRETLLKKYPPAPRFLPGRKLSPASFKMAIQSTHQPLRKMRSPDRASLAAIDS